MSMVNTLQFCFLLHFLDILLNNAEHPFHRSRPQVQIQNAQNAAQNIKQRQWHQNQHRQSRRRGQTSMHQLTVHPQMVWLRKSLTDYFQGSRRQK